MAFGEKIKSVVSKIKSIKHIEIIIAVIGVAVMLLVFSGLGNKSSGSATKETAVKTAEETDAVGEWERKLESVLSEIDGVGEARVMITVKGSVEKVTANTKTTGTNTSETGSGHTTSTNITESPVILNNNGKSEPYVLKEIMPEILGVIVVAEGATNAVTRLAIMRAVQTALQVNSSCVEIYAMK